MTTSQERNDKIAKIAGLVPGVDFGSIIVATSFGQSKPIYKAAPNYSGSLDLIVPVVRGLDWKLLRKVAKLLAKKLRLDGNEYSTWLIEVFLLGDNPAQLLCDALLEVAEELQWVEGRYIPDPEECDWEWRL